MRSLILFTSILALGCPPLELIAQEPIEPPAAIASVTGWSVIREDLEITLKPADSSMVVSGTVRLRRTGVESAASASIGLNSRKPLMRFRSVGCEGATGTLNAAHQRRPARLVAHLEFEQPHAMGAEIDVAFECERIADGNQLVVSERIAFASWVEAWYPIPDPEAGVSLSGASRAPGETRFVLPAGWSAVTNGRRISRVDADDGRVVEVWANERALSRSFAAGPFAVTRHAAGDLEVSLFTLSNAVRDPEQQVNALADAIGAMQDRFGAYPYPSYAIVEVPADLGEFGAASEQGFIMVKPTFLRVPNGNLPLFAHEAAHGWWGNTVGTTGPGALLCSESLAQYGAVLAIETLEGEAAATRFLRFSRVGYIPSQCARGYFGLVRAGHDMPLSQLRNSQSWEHNLSDAKGHWVYHMLRRRVGDEVFFATMRGLIASYDGLEMSLDDVRAAFVAAAPEADLPQFFGQWLDRPGAPALSCTWQDREGGGADVTISQMQGGEPFDLRLELALHLGDGSTVSREVHLTDTEQCFTLAVDSPVDQVEVDPSSRLLTWTREYGPAPHGAAAADLDPIVAAEARAMYLGTYTSESHGRVFQVVERGQRIGLSMGPKSMPLRHVSGHRFRVEEGHVEFVFESGDVVAMEFTADAGERDRATRN